tara:strand:+ start:30407 stop:31072 length:666 start_codon:yes stop_codon:yes gene_type:complete
MENNIKKFLQNKQFSYKVVAEEEFDSFFQDYEDDLEIGIISTNRDYIFSMDKNKVIGCAILFNQENSVRMPIANTTTLSNIYVNKEYRNKGISSNMIDLVIQKLKEDGKVLKRTEPDLDGKLYIFDQITKKTKEENLLVIPHNIDFIYYKIGRTNNYKHLNEEERIDKMYDLAEKMLQHKTLTDYDITDISGINLHFIDVLEEVIDKDKPQKPKNKNKFKS